MLLADLLSYVQANRRVCPQPQRWKGLWQMLPNRHRVGGGWEPPLPLILAAWWDTPPLLKMIRLHEHLEYAKRHGVFDQVDAFLRALPE